MPNYNGATYLKQSIDSVIDQTYTNWELIIIDDCSADNSVSIIEQFSNDDDRIKFYIIKQNSGTPGTPRNLGLEKANGEYIAFLDSDDIWHPQKLEIQLAFMLKNNSSFSFTNVKTFSNESEIKPYLLENFTSDKGVINKRVDYNYLLRKNFIKSCSTAILRVDIIKDKRFNDDPKFRAVEDYMFWLDILKINCKEAKWLKINSTFYRESNASISSSKLFMIKQNYKMYRYLFDKEKCKKKLIIYKMLSYFFYSIKNIINQKIKRN